MYVSHLPYGFSLEAGGKRCRFVSGNSEQVEVSVLVKVGTTFDLGGHAVTIKEANNQKVWVAVPDFTSDDVTKEPGAVIRLKKRPA